MLTTLTSVLAAVWQWLNSSFVIAFVGGLTGAVGGALGAQRIVERTRQREELLRELRNTNAATMVAFSACNAALALKKQHVQPMVEAFQSARSALLKFQAERSEGQHKDVKEYHVPLDLRTFERPVVPLESLKHIVYRELSVVGRPLALVAVLEQSLLGVTDAIAKREHLVQRFATGSIPENFTMHFYFGLQLPNGHLSQEYQDLVEGIYGYVDDVAFFSALLCADLMEHGKSLHSAFSKRFGKGAPPVSTADFSEQRSTGLIPPDSQYAAWLKAFVDHKATADGP
jgi:hypothetical protein